MKLIDLICEGRDAPLYHAFSKPKYAALSLKNNELAATSSQRFWADGKRRKDNDPEYNGSFWMKGVSFTRDFAYAKQWGDVVFQIDQTILTQQTKITPFNWGFSIPDNLFGKGNHQKREREEFAIVKKTPDTYVRSEEDGGGFDANRFNEPEGSIKNLDKMLLGIYVSDDIEVKSWHEQEANKLGVSIQDIIDHPKFKGFYKRFK